MRITLGPRGRTVLPLRQIVSNAAEEASVVFQRVDEAPEDAASFGFKANTRTFGDMLEMGVIDPAKVTRLALQNASSIAALILTTDCVIAEAPKDAQPRQASAAAPEF